MYQNYVVAMSLLATGCSEYGLGGLFDNHRADEPLVDGPKEDVPGSSPGDPSDDDVPSFPGEDPPDDWEQWDASCGGFGGPGGGPNNDSYIIDEPITGIQAMLTVGDLEIIAREGPVEVELHGVTLNGAQGPRFDGDILVLDYIATVGDLTVWVPPDLPVYDFRVCVGNLDIDGLGVAGEGTLTAEARTGRVDAQNLRVGTTFVHNRTGDTQLEHLIAPREVWAEGKTGFTQVDVAADSCDCTLDVGVGNTDLDGIAQDAGASLMIDAERSVGSIAVSALSP